MEPSSTSATDAIGDGVTDSASLQLLKKMDMLLRIHHRLRRKKSMREEVRSLEFWRAIIAECLAAFFYVFLVCGSYVPGQSLDVAGLQHGGRHGLQYAFTCGFAMCTLVLCFGHISGGHVNPAVTFSFFVTRKVTPLRAVLYITAQCGGAIAGAALLYGVTALGQHSALETMNVHSSISPWQGFGVEFVLTFIVVFTVFASMDPYYSLFNCPSPVIGGAYLVCSLAPMQATGAALNPARALGPAFVMNKWTNHWVYWFGPMSGGLLAGLIYEYIFDPKKGGRGLKEALGELSRAESSLQSQDEDYDDGDAKATKLSSQQYTTTPYHRAQHFDNYRPDNNYRPCNTSQPAGNVNYSSSHSIATSNYGQLPSAAGCGGGSGSNYGLLHHPPSSNYGGGGGSSSAGNNEPTYGTHHFRPNSTVAGSYATIHGNRPGGTTTRLPQRMEYGPGSTKF